jgi:hypothetical protein
VATNPREGQHSNDNRRNKMPEPHLCLRWMILNVNQGVKRVARVHRKFLSFL